MAVNTDKVYETADQDTESISSQNILHRQSKDVSRSLDSEEDSRDVNKLKGSLTTYSLPDGPLDNSHVDDVVWCVDDLHDWQSLGIELGLDHSTLDWIESKNQGNVESCKLDMLCFWLLRTDNVNQKGGATKQALAAALRRMGESNIASRITGDHRLRDLLGVIESLKEKHFSLTVKPVKLVFTGPPRVGKTTLKKRLTKEIINLTTHPNPFPSTGLEKPQVLQVSVPSCTDTRICEHVAFGIAQSGTSGDASSWDWKELNLEEQISILLDSIAMLPQKSEQHAPQASHDEPPTERKRKKKRGSEEANQQKVSQPSPLPPSQKQSSHLPVDDESVPSSSGSTLATTMPLPSRELAMEVEDLARTINWEKTRKKLRVLVEEMVSVYVMDTGGQPEFHEVLPHVLQGPALHLVLFSLLEKDNVDCLDRQFEVEYVSEELKSVVPYKSVYPVNKVLFQLLSSFYSLHKSQEVRQVLQNMTLNPALHHPQAVLIGTYKDVFLSKSASQCFDRINQKLITTFKGADFLEKDFLSTVPHELRRPCTQQVSGNRNTYFLAVDNMHGTEEDMAQFRHFLAERISRIALPVELPCSVLLFHLLLRSHYEKDPGYCTRDQCDELAKKCEIPLTDVTKVLKYLHLTLGTVLYYEDVDSLTDIVFCNPNLLLNQINRLIAVCFTCDPAKTVMTEKARDTGIIEPELLEHVRLSQKHGIISYDQVIDFLLHHKLMMKIGGMDGEGKLFMPCLLLPNPGVADITNDFLKKCSILPLLLQFPGEIVPAGLFTSLVVQLCQKEWVSGEPWEAAEDIPRYRNQITFLTDSHLRVTLTARPHFIEVLVQEDCTVIREDVDLQTFCPRVKDHVTEAIENTKFGRVFNGFYCPGSLVKGMTPHYAKVRSGQNYVRCSRGKECAPLWNLPSQGFLWFPKQSKDKDSVNAAHNSSDRCVEPMVDNSLLSVDNLVDVLEAVQDETNWFDLGLVLRLAQPQLKEIRQNYRENVSDCRREMLSSWLRKEPKVTHPSWKTLTEALQTKLVGNSSLADIIAKAHPSQGKA